MLGEGYSPLAPLPTRALFIADSVYPKIRFWVAGTRSVTTKRNNVNFNINPNLIEITGT